MEHTATGSPSAEPTRVDAAAAAFACQPGDLLCDRFRVVRFIARGGMGELYESEDLELHERVALKTIRQEVAADERMIQRFRREVQLALHNDAEVLFQQGNLTRARAVEEEALGIRRGIDDPASLSTSLTGLAQVAAAQGDLPTAKQLLAEGMAIDRRLDRRRAIAYDLYRLGDIAFVEGKLVEARQRHEEALAIRMQLGEKGTAAESRAALGVLALEEARFADAEALTREAAAVFEGQKGSDNEALARASLALALHAQGRSSPALREIAGAGALVRNTQNVRARFQVSIAAARIDAANGNRPAAARSLESIRAEAAGLGIMRDEFDSRRALVEALPPDSSEAATQMTALRKDAGPRGFGLYAAPRRLLN
jgi:tetratricopeptide (TPR) repeat protein